MATTEELLTELVAVSREQLQWNRAAALPQARETVDGALTRTQLRRAYELCDGTRNQAEVYELLDGKGIETSLMSVSRNLPKMQTERGIVELVSAGRSKVYRKGDESEDVLDLSTNIRKWLKEGGEIDPAPPRGR